MTWKLLETEAQLQNLINSSFKKTMLIFKHSTRCNISEIAKLRLEEDWDFSIDEIEAWYLDLIQYRSISNKIADQFQVYHESPQVLVIKNGECICDLSHLDISIDELKSCFSEN